MKLLESFKAEVKEILEWKKYGINTKIVLATLVIVIAILLIAGCSKTDAPVAQPVVEYSPEPEDEIFLEPIVEVVPEPIVEAVVEPIVEPIVEPVVEPTPDPIVEPTPEPVVVEPTPEPVIVDPIVEPNPRVSVSYSIPS